MNTYLVYDYRVRLFSHITEKVTKLTWGMQFRYGRGMNGRHLSGTTKTIRNRIFINPITAPPKKDLVDQIGFWGWQAKYCYKPKVKMLWTTKTITNQHRQWFKYNSLLRKLRRIKWIIQTSCIRYETV